MVTVLVGFNEFGPIEINPSRLVIEELARRRNGLNDTFIAEVLPTEFAAAGERVVRLIQSHGPQVVIIVGVAAGREAINLERIALNLDDAELPDNAGECRIGSPNMAHGPLARSSTLPLNELLDALRERQIPACISNHAGTFVCNHVHYRALHALAESESRAMCGLIHIPLMTELLKPEAPPRPTLPKTRVVEAVELCLTECERIAGGVAFK
jgi:pyroglutamyl-peptidase